MCTEAGQQHLASLIGVFCNAYVVLLPGEYDGNSKKQRPGGNSSSRTRYPTHPVQLAFSGSGEHAQVEDYYYILLHLKFPTVLVQLLGAVHLEKCQYNLIVHDCMGN